VADYFIPVRRKFMNASFERNGPLMELSSYPQWAQDMVDECEETKQSVANHEMWSRMAECRLKRDDAPNFLVGLWPVIEGFPGFMARSLIKTRYGRSAGDDMARRWLVRNIRIEQNHAEYWLHWADGHDIPRTSVTHGAVAPGSQILAEWCRDISTNGTLAASIAATNYAVEGVTGEWAQKVYESEQYRNGFPAEKRAASLRWLKLHAAYDDQHPWEALEIVCTLLGTSPAAREVAHIGECIRRTYVCMRIFGDRCLYGSESVAEPEMSVA
jgi:pyrroloquinoline quinone (PQQ) biosynthesis protein C